METVFPTAISIIVFAGLSALLLCLMVELSIVAARSGRMIRGWYLSCRQHLMSHVASSAGQPVNA